MTCGLTFSHFWGLLFLICKPKVCMFTLTYLLDSWTFSLPTHTDRDGEEKGGGKSKILCELRRHCESTVLVGLHETFPNKVNLAFKCYLFVWEGFSPLFQQAVNVIFFLNQSPTLFGLMKPLISLSLLHIKISAHKFVLTMAWHILESYTHWNSVVLERDKINRSIRQETEPINGATHMLKFSLCHT